MNNNLNNPEENNYLSGNSLAKYLFNNIAFDDKYYINDCCSRYIATYDFNQTVLFSL